MITAPAEQPENSDLSISRGADAIAVAHVIAIVACFALLYRGVIVKLVSDWATDDNYSHGFLIVPIALYLAWERRDKLRCAAARSPADWPADRAGQRRRARRGRDRRRAVPDPHLDDRHARRSDRLPLRLAASAGTDLPGRVPAADGAAAGDHLQQDHVPAAAAGVAGRRVRHCLDEHPGAARGQHHRPCPYQARSRRGLQRHPLAGVAADPGHRLRVLHRRPRLGALGDLAERDSGGHRLQRDAHHRHRHCRALLRPRGRRRVLPQFLRLGRVRRGLPGDAGGQAARRAGRQLVLAPRAWEAPPHDRSRHRDSHHRALPVPGPQRRRAGPRLEIGTDTAAGAIRPPADEDRRVPGDARRRPGAEGRRRAWRRGVSQPHLSHRRQPRCRWASTWVTGQASARATRFTRR